jgi:hypothetical protein
MRVKHFCCGVKGALAFTAIHKQTFPLPHKHGIDDVRSDAFTASTDDFVAGQSHDLWYVQQKNKLLYRH